MARSTTPPEDGNGADDRANAPLGKEAEKLLRMIRELQALGDADRLGDTATKLLKENVKLQHTISDVREKQKEISDEISKLLEPEHFPAVVTNLERNGKLTAEVAGPGVGRAHVAIHPDVPEELLHVGARVVLAKKQNCVLRVSTIEPPWREVGTFEQYLDDKRRALVRYQDQLVAVTLAEELRRLDIKKGTQLGFDRDGAGLAYVIVPPANGTHLFTDDFPDDDFARLGGLDAEVGLIKRLIEFRFHNPQVAERYRLPSKVGILLSGAPGNGKTRIARCAAAHVTRLCPNSPCRFMLCIGSGDYSMWLGQSEARIKERFAAIREASQNGPVVAFFDEIDAMGRRRGTDQGSSAPDRILSTFLGELDGVKKLENVLIMAATNRADTLDPGLTRAGRFDRKVEIPAPNRVAARAVLSGYLHPLPLADNRAIQDLVEPLLARIYSPAGEYNEVVAVKFADGRKLAIPARALVSCAMLENVVKVASEDAAAREVLMGPDGITPDDLTLAFDLEMQGLARMLTPANLKAYVTGIPAEANPIAVTPGERFAHAAR